MRRDKNPSLYCGDGVMLLSHIKVDYLKANTFVNNYIQGKLIKL
ncbi:hypothetical protein RINTHH_10820 [Richelia intracellularis HH01]|uniref:Uncharacterized protein n=1 Tax=Richelia intracellularis HH01 TaxID=1165094 RepID=M1WZ39_9NOST|nr:hypothetical protein RINTHH_10820 [Richelia intracellularis HH01]